MSPETRAAAGAWHGQAFGLALTSQFELVGFPEAAADPSLREVALELQAAENLRRPFDVASEAIAWRREPDGTPVAADVLAHRDDGYLMIGRSDGHFRISPRGDHVWCAPSAVEDWRWQRYLLGRALPFAATLRGLEPLHASAVALGKSAVAMIAGPKVGKTTIAAEMLLRGAQLIADDVAVVEISDGSPLLHPGPPLMSLRTGPRPLFTRRELAELGETVGAADGSSRLSVSRAERPLPLELIYLLGRCEAGDAVLEAPVAPDPSRLLAGTFNFALRDPARLRRLLDVSSTVARSVTQIRVDIPPGCDLRHLAARLLDDAQERLELLHAG